MAQNKTAGRTQVFIVVSIYSIFVSHRQMKMLSLPQVPGDWAAGGPFWAAQLTFVGDGGLSWRPFFSHTQKPVANRRLL